MYPSSSSSASTLYHPSSSSTITISSPSPISCNVFAFVSASARTRRVCVFSIVAIFCTSSFATSSAASPERIYSLFTYPVTFPDLILYQPSFVSRISQALCFVILPTISPLADASSRTFKLPSVILAIPKFLYPQIVPSSCAAVTIFVSDSVTNV